MWGMVRAEARGVGRGHVLKLFPVGIKSASALREETWTGN